MINPFALSEFGKTKVREWEHGPGEKYAPVMGNRRTANKTLTEAGALLVKVKTDPSHDLLEKHSHVLMEGFFDELEKIAAASSDETANILRSLLMAMLGKTENMSISVDRAAQERTMFGDGDSGPNYNQRVQEMAAMQQLQDSRLQSVQQMSGNVRSVF